MSTFMQVFFSKSLIQLRIGNFVQRDEEHLIFVAIYMKKWRKKVTPVIIMPKIW